MESGNRFWLAKGSCAGCARPIAKRASTAGPIDVACNVCRQVTRLVAEEYVPTPEGPRRVEASVEAPPVRPKARWVPWVLAGIVVILLVGGAAAWMAVRATDAGGAQDWETMRQTGTIRAIPGAHELTFTLVANDASGAVIPLDRLRSAPMFNSTTAPSLVDPSALTGWHACDMRECDVVVPDGNLLFFVGMAPLQAIDLTTNHTWSYFLNKWEDHGVDSKPFDWRLAVAHPSVGVVELVVHDNGTQARDLNVTLLRDGAYAGRAIVRTSSPSFRFPAFGDQVTAGAGSFTLKVVSPTGLVLAERDYAGACGTKIANVALDISRTDDVALGELSCPAGKGG